MTTTVNQRWFAHTSTPYYATFGHAAALDHGEHVVERDGRCCGCGAKLEYGPHGLEYCRSEWRKEGYPPFCCYGFDMTKDGFKLDSEGGA